MMSNGSVSCRKRLKVLYDFHFPARSCCLSRKVKTPYEIQPLAFFTLLYCVRISYLTLYNIVALLIKNLAKGLCFHHCTNLKLIDS